MVWTLVVCDTEVREGDLGGSFLLLSVQFSSVAQSCPTLCNPRDYTTHVILQAILLEWVAFPFSRVELCIPAEIGALGIPLPKLLSIVCPTLCNPMDYTYSP